MKAKCVVSCISLLALLSACSSKQMYEGEQAGNRSQCQKYPELERTQCLESANVRYEDYERERNKARTE